MKTIRTATVRYALTAAAALVMLGSFAATSAFAGDLTRAEVKAQVIAAQAAGTLGSVGQGYGYDDHGRLLTGSSKSTRAEVRAATVRALAGSRTEAQLGDSYGSTASTGLGRIL